MSDAGPAVDNAPSERADRPRWGVGLTFLTLVLGTAGAVVGASLAALASGDAPGETSLAATAGSLAGMWAVYLTMIGLAVRRDGRGWAATLGLRWRPLDVPLGVVAGLVSSIVVVQLVYVVLQVARVIEEDDLDRLDDPARALGDTAQGPAFVVLAILIGIGAPVVEEVFFRGFMQRALVARFGALAGVVVTALVFGAVHLQVLQFPALFAFGLVLGVLAHRTGRLAPSIVTHMVFNGLTLVALALG